MSKDTSGPAFPCTEANGLNNGVPGMTLRQYYAGLAMQGMMPFNWHKEYKDVALVAFAMADAMIAEGNK